MLDSLTLGLGDSTDSRFATVGVARRLGIWMPLRALDAYRWMSESGRPIGGRHGIGREESGSRMPIGRGRRCRIPACCVTDSCCRFAGCHSLRLSHSHSLSLSFSLSNSLSLSLTLSHSNSLTHSLSLTRESVSRSRSRRLSRLRRWSGDSCTGAAYRCTGFLKRCFLSTAAYIETRTESVGGASLTTAAYIETRTESVGGAFSHYGGVHRNSDGVCWQCAHSLCRRTSNNRTESVT